MKAIFPTPLSHKAKTWVVAAIVFTTAVCGLIVPIQFCLASDLSPTEEQSSEAELRNDIAEIFGPDERRRESEASCRWHEEQCREEETPSNEI